MSKISRNDRCPCGSGKKYKKCCLQRDEANAISMKNQDTRKIAPLKEQMADFYADTEALDTLSNSVVDLIDEKKWKEAEKACNELLARYLDQVDGLHRYAMMYEAKGEKEKAVEYYEKAAEFAKEHDSFGSEFIESMEEKIKALKG